jgi:hypothetical protein
VSEFTTTVNVINDLGGKVINNFLTATDLRILANTLDKFDRDGSATVHGYLSFLTQSGVKYIFPLGYDDESKTHRLSLSV